MTPRLRTLSLVALLAASTPSVAMATTVVPVTTEELTIRSDDVVVATVRASSSRWEHGLIVTDHELVVDATVRGRAVVGATMYVRTPGGVVGRIAQSVPDAPALVVGQSYVFFLSGGVGPVRFLAHLTAAVVPVHPTASGELVAQPTSALLVTNSHGAAVAEASPVALPRLLDLVRAVRR